MSKSVLIIDTPKSCDKCKLNYDCCGCMITGTNFWYTESTENKENNFNPDTQILPDCPLSPLPPHKDLTHYVHRGDAKSMTHMMMSIHDAGYNHCLDDLQKGEENEK